MVARGIGRVRRSVGRVRRSVGGTRVGTSVDAARVGARVDHAAASAAPRPSACRAAASTAARGHAPVFDRRTTCAASSTHSCRSRTAAAGGRAAGVTAPAGSGRASGRAARGAGGSASRRRDGAPCSAASVPGSRGAIPRRLGLRVERTGLRSARGEPSTECQRTNDWRPSSARHDFGSSMSQAIAGTPESGLHRAWSPAAVAHFGPTRTPGSPAGGTPDRSAPFVDAEPRDPGDG